MIDPLGAIMSVMEESFDPELGEAWNIRQVASSLSLANTHALLIAANGLTPSCVEDTAGFAMSRYAPGEEELLLVAVRPDYRRSGLGTRLLALLAEQARDRGAERIFLEMRQNNPAETVYRAAGFEPIGRRRSYYKVADGTRLDAITFARDL